MEAHRNSQASQTLVHECGPEHVQDTACHGGTPEALANSFDWLGQLGGILLAWPLLQRPSTEDTVQRLTSFRTCRLETPETSLHYKVLCC